MTVHNGVRELEFNILFISVHVRLVSRNTITLALITQPYNPKQ